jgi:hypothetical protein
LINQISVFDSEPQHFDQEETLDHLKIISDHHPAEKNGSSAGLKGLNVKPVNFF